MCTTNIYTTVYPDGRKETSRVPSLCSHARHGIPCSKNVIFQHPASYVSNAGKPSSAPTSGSPFLPTTGGHLPPSPAYTPRSGTPNNYRSGDESDRSGGYRSGSSSRSKKSPTVYINGQRVYELDPYSSPSSSRRHHKERVVIRDGPPSPHASPAGFTSAAHIVDASPDGHHRRRRASHSQSHSRTNPVVIENPSTRPMANIEVVDPRDYRHSSSSSRHHGSSSKHARHGSASSSHDSSAARRSHDDEEAREARRRRRERRQHEYEQAERVYSQRSVKWNDRIAAANAHIANRPVVPPPAANTSAPRRSSFREAELVDAVQGLHISHDGRRRHSRSQEAEDEAMKQRLRDRMMPRRATVSGRPRHQVLYDDGTVRWE